MSIGDDMPHAAVYYNLPPAHCYQFYQFPAASFYGKQQPLPYYNPLPHVQFLPPPGPMPSQVQVTCQNYQPRPSFPAPVINLAHAPIGSERRKRASRGSNHSWNTSPKAHSLAAPRRDSASSKVESDSKSVAEQIMAADGSDVFFRNIQLIPASASSIAPHPAIEDSGVPYATFAADLVWELCNAAVNPVSPTSRSHSRFGAIGSERIQHSVNRSTDSIASLMSSLSDLPSDRHLTHSTPPSSAQSLACPIPEHWQTNGKFVGEKAAAPWLVDNCHSPTDSPGALSRGLDARSSLASFRRFVDTLLSVTLITPQTLLLALLYVDRTIRGDASAIGTRFSTRSAPYKLFIAALVLANKILDDNSYTSQTWSKVSAISLDDINQSEAYMFGLLKFDLDIATSDWLYWLRVMINRRASAIPSVTFKTNGVQDVLLCKLLELESAIAH